MRFCLAAPRQRTRVPPALLGLPPLVCHFVRSPSLEQVKEWSASTTEALGGARPVAARPRLAVYHRPAGRLPGGWQGAWQQLLLHS